MATSIFTSPPSSCLSPFLVKTLVPSHKCPSDSIFRKSYPALGKGRGGWGGGWSKYVVERWEYDEEWFWPFELFAKLKATFCTYCTYWLSIKIKFSMTCKYQEYSIKMKMARQLWTQFKMKFLSSDNMEIVM